MTERLVARALGKETLPFRSDGIPREWRPGLSTPGRRRRSRPGTEAFSGRVPGLRRTLVGCAGVLGQLDEKGPGWNEQVPERGRRERWNCRYLVSEQIPRPGTLQGSERDRRYPDPT